MHLVDPQAPQTPMVIDVDQLGKLVVADEWDSEPDNGEVLDASPSIRTPPWPLVRHPERSARVGASPRWLDNRRTGSPAMSALSDVKWTLGQGAVVYVENHSISRYLGGPLRRRRPPGLAQDVERKGRRRRLWVFGHPKAGDLFLMMTRAEFCERAECGNELDFDSIQAGDGLCSSCVESLREEEAGTCPECGSVLNDNGATWDGTCEACEWDPKGEPA